MPQPPEPKRTPAPQPQPTPAGLLYTILRHGRGLSSEQAAQLVQEAVTRPRKAA